MDMERSSSTERFQPITSVKSHDGIEIGEDLYSYTIQIVNVIFYGKPGAGNDWVLIDAGMPKSGEAIKKAAVDRFGEDNPPKAIILTHAHFDHIGGLIDLLEEWDVPVYAHPLEIPYITGKKDYPLPDMTVEGGVVAKMSAMFPHESIDIGDHAHELPKDKTVPEMPGWRWIHTPGHSKGHVSLYRESDGTLIVGDAFVATKQDSLYQVVTQKRDISGPPVYLTPDWKDAEQSVKTLNQLNLEVAITGHGVPLNGEYLKDGLKDLAENFKEKAVPSHGKYVDEEDK